MRPQRALKVVVQLSLWKIWEKTQAGSVMQSDPIKDWQMIWGGEMLDEDEGEEKVSVVKVRDELIFYLRGQIVWILHYIDLNC